MYPVGALQIETECGAVFVLTPRGDLSPDTADHLRSELLRHLVDQAGVLVDLGRLSLDTPSAARVFSCALSNAGGWPSARLVLFGADAPTVDMLRSEGVPGTVPLAVDRDTARPLLATRPDRISRCCAVSDIGAVKHVRAFVEQACADWGMAGRFPDATLVATELMTNAIIHAGTPGMLIVSLDEHGLHLAVRDESPQGEGMIRMGRARPGNGRGLHLVSELSRAWGVATHADAKTVWAVLSH